MVYKQFSHNTNQLKIEISRELSTILRVFYDENLSAMDF